MVKVTRRIIGRSALLDTPIDSPRFTYQLQEKWYDSFFAQYPAATTAEQLHAELAPALEGAGLDVPADLIAKLRKLHPATGIFQGIAHWSRVERAHREASARARSGERHRGPSITYPLRQPLPIKLAEMLAESLTDRIAKEKRPRRRIVHSRT